jgi:hypothetical protein
MLDNAKRVRAANGALKDTLHAAWIDGAIDYPDSDAAITFATFDPSSASVAQLKKYKACSKMATQHRTAIDAAVARLDDVRAVAEDAHAELEDTPIPVVNSYKIEGDVEHKEEKITRQGDTMVMSGRCYLAGITTGATDYPIGQKLMDWPLAPQSLGSSRLQVESTVFDVYAWRKCAVHYVSNAASSSGGSVLGFCAPDAMSDPTNANTGVALVRDGMSRPGSEMNQLFSKGVYTINFPQQAWYYTDSADLGNLSQAGMFYLIATSALPSGLSVANMFIDYEIEFKQASLDRTTQGGFVGPNNGVQFAIPNQVAGGQLFCNIGEMPAGGLLSSARSDWVGRGTVTGVYPGTGDNPWINLTVDGTPWPGGSLSVGNTLHWRLDPSLACVVFYASRGACLGNTAPATPTTLASADGAIVSTVAATVGGAPTIVMDQVYLEQVTSASL